jgi:choline-glycine betaine transporter
MTRIRLKFVWARYKISIILLLKPSSANIAMSPVSAAGRRFLASRSMVLNIRTGAPVVALLTSDGRPDTSTRQRMSRAAVTGVVAAEPLIAGEPMTAQVASICTAQPVALVLSIGVCALPIDFSQEADAVTAMKRAAGAAIGPPRCVPDSLASELGVDNRGSPKPIRCG